MKRKTRKAELPVQLNYCVDDGRPTITVRLSSSLSKGVGELKGNNVETLEQLAKHDPSILEEQHLVRLQSESMEQNAKVCSGDPLPEKFACTPNAIDMLFSAAASPPGHWYRGIGSNVVVRVCDSSESLMHTAQPPELTMVAEVENDAKEIAAALRRGIKSSKDKDPEATAKAVEATAATYRRIYTLRQKGFGNKEISEETGVPRKTLANQFARQLKPNSIRSRLKLTQSSGKCVVVIPQQESVDFAYLLGAYCARTDVGVSPIAVVFNPNDVEVADKLERSIRSIMPEGKIKRETDARRKTWTGGDCLVQVNHMELGRRISEITANNTQIPWEHLVTREERISFVLDYFDCGGTITSRVVAATKTNAESMFGEMRVLLRRLEIPSTTFSGKTGATLEIGSAAGISQYKQTIGATSQRRSEKLQKCAGHKKEAPKGSTQIAYAESQWREFNEIFDANSGLGPAKLMELLSFSMPKPTLINWRKYKQGKVGSRPRLMKTTESIDKTEGTMPNPDLIGRLYRIEGLTQGETRLLADLLFALDIAAPLPRKELDEQVEGHIGIFARAWLGMDNAQQVTGIYFRRLAEINPGAANQAFTQLDRWVQEDFPNAARPTPLSADGKEPKKQAKGTAPTTRPKEPSPPKRAEPQPPKASPQVNELVEQIRARVTPRIDQVKGGYRKTQIRAAANTLYNRGIGRDIL